MGFRTLRPFSSPCSRKLLGALLVPLMLGAQTPDSAPPESDRQDRILASMHRYADRYITGLPNFLCMQTVRQWESNIKGKRWHEGDMLVSRLSFHDGEERRALELVNGKPVEAAHKRWRMPLTTEGEFGILLSQILGQHSEASFQWNRWEILAGKRMAVFDFSVDREHSTLRLRLSDLAHAVVPYSGSVYADPETGAVWRISDKASDIPAALQTREIGTTVDYAEVKIGESVYLMPSQATVTLLLSSSRIRNEIEFTDYRKFAANSVIQFDREVPGAEPH